jgi:hypothetical protein
MFISRLGASYHLNHSLYCLPPCQISICSLRVFKTANAFQQIQNQINKKNIFHQKFNFCKIGLAFLFMQNQINNMRTLMPSIEQIPGLEGPNSDAKKYKDSLIELITSIKEWEKWTEKEQRVPVIDFMDALGRLFLDYFQHHLDEANACAVQYQSLLNYSVDPITSYIINLWHRLRSADDYDDPWEEACWGRTNIEAFNTMFKQVLDFPLNPQGIDDYMNDTKGKNFLPWKDIPKNAPASHWWWFEEYGTSWLEED